MGYEIGEHAIVFDPRIWHKQGKDINHNEACYKEAVIENIRYNVPSYNNQWFYDVLYDVRFLYDGFLSRGHFESSISKIS